MDESQRRNFERWPILGEYIWPNYFIGDSYNAEITYLKEWIALRFNWLDDNLPTIIDRQIIIPENIFAKNYPNPFNGQTAISIRFPRFGRVNLTIRDINGRTVKNLFNSSLNAGEHHFLWDGTDNANKIVSSGIYIYTLLFENHRMGYGKMIYLK